MGAARGLIDVPPVEPRPVQSTPDPWVPRFGATERFLHWWTVLMLAIALLSGLGMGDDGGTGPMLIVHAGSVALMGLAVAGALAFGNRRAVLRAAHRLFVIDRRDRTWLSAMLRHPLARRPDPEWGMFNAGQKVLAWALVMSLGAVIITGVQSWSAGGEGGPHGAFALLTVALLGCHVFMAVVNPATRPALAGMVRGHVRRSWAAKHHPDWLRETDERRPIA